MPEKDERGMVRQVTGEVYGAYATTVKKIKELLTFDNINDVDVLNLFNETNRDSGKKPTGVVSEDIKNVLRKHGIHRDFKEVDATHSTYVNEKGQRVVFEHPKQVDE